MTVIGYEGREIRKDLRSETYFNLHDHCFSMRQKGLVVLHADNIYMEDVTFAVQEAGREKVREEGRKNVHAYVRGTYLAHDLSNEVCDQIKEGMREAYYNPYKTETFVDRETGEPIYEADIVLCVDKKVFYWIG